jgi:RNA polymerase sigma factor (sigma-70 family)
MPSPAALRLHLPAGLGAALPVEAPSDPDGRLLDQLSRGDVAALDAVLGRYWSPLVTYLTGFLQSGEAAEDVAQETFYRLWEHRAKLRAEGSLRGFIYQVARNLAISEQRRSQALERTVRAMDQEGPSFAFIEMNDDGAYLVLKQAVSELPARRREILLLHSVNGLSYKEIAELLGIAPQTVANQFSAALATLRQAIPWRSMV